MFQVNEYFDGKVKSIGFEGPELASTVGVMAPGSYEFGTSQKETMTVVAGSLRVRLPGEKDFRVYVAGEHFVVAANETFAVEVASDTAYLCTYA